VKNDASLGGGTGVESDQEDAGQLSDVERGLQRAARAEAAFLSSLADGLDEPVADLRAREALRLAASALNWLEDSEFEPYAHYRMDELGLKVRLRFPETCALTWTGRDYEQRCRVSIAHKRVGLSPGFIAKHKVCVLCGGDPAECEHMPNRKYRVRGGKGPAGY
jgi:hypothetical protein